MVIRRVPGSGRVEQPSGIVAACPNEGQQETRIEEGTVREAHDLPRGGDQDLAVHRRELPEMDNRRKPRRGLGKARQSRVSGDHRPSVKREGREQGHRIAQ